MFGPKLTQIFRSRWAALWWAALMLFMAWQIVPSPDDEPSDGASASATATATNPWALASSAPAAVR